LVRRRTPGDKYCPPVVMLLFGAFRSASRTVAAAPITTATATRVVVTMTR
jgi:hypothetical protein